MEPHEMFWIFPGEGRGDQFDIKDTSQGWLKFLVRWTGRK